MAEKILSIKDLIARKEEIQNRKAEQFELDSPIGTLVVKKMTDTLMSDVMEMSSDGDAYVIYHSVVEPNLKDSELQKAYGCMEPTDIVGKLFNAGEILSIAKKIAQLSGYGNEPEARLYKEIKN